MLVKYYIDNFDVTLGSFDSAQIADSKWIFTLETLGRIMNQSDISLYRDNGLILNPDINCPKTLKNTKENY